MDEESRIQNNFLALNHEGRRMLLEFSEFLRGRYALQDDADAEPAAAPIPVQVSVPEPEAIPRPEEESVVGAMKRLSRTYFMVDRNKIFAHASALMTEHMIQGRDVVEVIDELEDLFQRQYQKMIDGERDD